MIFKCSSAFKLQQIANEQTIRLILEKSRFRHTYCPFLTGLWQTQWNFHPKSMYRSSLTTWNILPVTIFPSGSPNWKQNCVCLVTSNRILRAIVCTARRRDLHRQTWSCESRKRTSAAFSVFYRQCARTFRNFAQSRSISPRIPTLLRSLSFVFRTPSRCRAPRARTNRCFVPLNLYSCWNISWTRNSLSEHREIANTLTFFQNGVSCSWRQQKFRFSSHSLTVGNF